MRPKHSAKDDSDKFPNHLYAAFLLMSLRILW